MGKASRKSLTPAGKSNTSKRAMKKRSEEVAKALIFKQHERLSQALLLLQILKR